MTDASTISTPQVRSIGVAALLSTLAATLTFLVVAFVVLLPFSVLYFEELGALIPPVCYAVAVSAPVTLVLLPLAAIFLRRDIPALIILSIVGSIGGVIAAWPMRLFLVGDDPVFLGLGVTLGAIGGLAAGLCFGLVLMRLGK